MDHDSTSAKDNYIKKLESLSHDLKVLQNLWETRTNRPFLFHNLVSNFGSVDAYFVCDHVGCNCRVVVRSYHSGAPKCREHSAVLSESMNIPMSEAHCWIVNGAHVESPKDTLEETDG